jgi:hypothetical protein
MTLNPSHPQLWEPQLLHVFIYGLFNDGVSSRDYVVSTGRVAGKYCVRKRPWCNMLYCPGICLAGLRKITRNPSQDSRFSDKDWKLPNMNRECYPLESREPKKQGKFARKGLHVS